MFTQYVIDRTTNMLVGYSDGKFLYDLQYRHGLEYSLDKLCFVPIRRITCS